jgi:hypothetical protein
MVDGIESGDVDKESIIYGDVINDHLNDLIIGNDNDIEILDVDEGSNFFNEGIIPQSWYDYFKNPEPEIPIEGLRDDIEISDLNENPSFFNEDHFINNLIPFQEGDPSNILMTDYIFPGIDSLSNIDMSNIGDVASDVGSDLMKMVPNTIMNIPETYRDILTLPFQGARDISRGDYLDAALNPALAAEPTNSLFNYSDNPVSSFIGKTGEYLGGLYGAKKIQDAIMQAKNTPNWLKSFFRQGYPHFTKSATAGSLESILPSFKNIKKGLSLKNTLSALRGYGQYGLASSAFSIPLSVAAFAVTPSQSADHDEAGLNWERSQDPNKYNFSPTDFKNRFNEFTPNNLNTGIMRSDPVVFDEYITPRLEALRNRPTERPPSNRQPGLDNYRGR